MLLFGAIRQARESDVTRAVIGYGGDRCGTFSRSPPQTRLPTCSTCSRQQLSSANEYADSAEVQDYSRSPRPPEQDASAGRHSHVNPPERRHRSSPLHSPSLALAPALRHAMHPAYSSPPLCQLPLTALPLLHAARTRAVRPPLLAGSSSGSTKCGAPAIHAVTQRTRRLPCPCAGTSHSSAAAPVQHTGHTARAPHRTYPATSNCGDIQDE